jgi:hypothetical protein
VSMIGTGAERERVITTRALAGIAGGP